MSAMRAACLLVLSFIATACPRDATTQIRPATQVAAQRTPAPPTDLRRLAEAVREVPSGVDDPNHGNVVAALSLVAELLRAEDPDAAARIDVLATQLMRSPPNERGHADLARDALAAALESYARRLPLATGRDERDAYVAGQRAIDRISDDEPLRFQLQEVAAALRSLTNLEALARDLAPMFVPVYEQVEVAFSAPEMRSRSERASDAVSALAAERGWEAAGAKAANALDAIADVLEVSPLTMDVIGWQAAVNTIRYEAVQLAREPQLSLRRSDHVKAGLAACVQALQSVSAERRGHVSRAFVERADVAVERIAAGVPFVFQRAIIQEAFRTCTDALVVIAGAPSDDTT